MFKYFKNKRDERTLASVANLENESIEYLMSAWSALDFEQMEGNDSQAVTKALSMVEDELDRRGHVDSFGHVFPYVVSEKFIDKESNNNSSVKKVTIKNDGVSKKDEIYFANKNYKVVGGDSYFIGVVGKLVSFCSKDKRVTILTDTNIEITLDASNIELV